MEEGSRIAKIFHQIQFEDNVVTVLNFPERDNYDFELPKLIECKIRRNLLAKRVHFKVNVKELSFLSAEKIFEKPKKSKKFESRYYCKSFKNNNKQNKIYRH